jgi:hypothetical protein
LVRRQAGRQLSQELQQLMLFVSHFSNSIYSPVHGKSGTDVPSISRSMVATFKFTPGQFQIFQ